MSVKYGLATPTATATVNKYTRRRTKTKQNKSAKFTRSQQSVYTKLMKNKNAAESSRRNGSVQQNMNIKPKLFLCCLCRIKSVNEWQTGMDTE